MSPFFCSANLSGKILDTPLTQNKEDTSDRYSTHSGAKKDITLSTSQKESTGVSYEGKVKQEEEEKIKQDINSYIIESYKAQWTKIIKDLNNKLSKTLPADADRKDAYEKIRSSLALRKKRIENTPMSDTKKLILDEFLEHMIDLLDKKIAELN